MLAASIIGGVISTAVGGYSIYNTYEKKNLVDRKFHVMAELNHDVYMNTQRLIASKRVTALNTLTSSYNSSGFSVNSGTGAKEKSAIDESFNQLLEGVNNQYKLNLESSQIENDLAQQNLNLEYGKAISSIYNGITNSIKLANNYSGDVGDGGSAFSQSVDARLNKAIGSFDDSYNAIQSSIQGHTDTYGFRDVTGFTSPDNWLY